ncbi:MAG: GNAT family N-acetyltransferase [Chloroflexi bacterium]|nr:GNAT family N-acetyltransferase [Chloroflexota bacterium]
MISTPSFIQRVTNLSREQVRDLAGMFARAFQQDPLFVHALPEEHTRSPRLKKLFALNIRYGLLFGEVYHAAQQGLAIWLPPGHTKVTSLRALLAGMGRVPFEVGLRAVLRLGRLNTLSERLHERLAGEPHWYLFQLGVDPARQGGGLGGLLLSPVLARADAMSMPCYLETNNPRAVRFYQKLGFQVAAEGRNAALNLSYWAMRRESR